MGVTKIEILYDDVLDQAIDFSKTKSGLSEGAHKETVRIYDGTQLLDSKDRNFTIVAPAISYEPETVAYMDALGIADNSTASAYGITNRELYAAVDKLVLKLKADGNWSIVNRLFLRLGSTATQMALNLKNINANGNYFGSWVFNNTGALSNGTNAYFDSGVNLKTVYGGTGSSGFTQTINNFELVTGETYPNAIGASEGGTNRFQLYIAWNNNPNQVGVYSKSAVATGSNNGAGKGIHTLSASTGNVGTHFKNGISVNSDNITGENPDMNIFEGAYNTGSGANRYAKLTIGSSAYHSGLTATQAANLCAALNQFEIDINRKQY